MNEYLRDDGKSHPYDTVAKIITAILFLLIGSAMAYMFSFIFIKSVIFGNFLVMEGQTSFYIALFIHIFIGMIGVLVLVGKNRLIPFMLKTLRFMLIMDVILMVLIVIPNLTLMNNDGFYSRSGLVFKHSTWSTSTITKKSMVFSEIHIRHDGETTYSQNPFSYKIHQEIDVSGATTIEITDEDFLLDNYDFFKSSFSKVKSSTADKIVNQVEYDLISGKSLKTEKVVRVSSLNTNFLNTVIKNYSKYNKYTPAQIKNFFSLFNISYGG